MAISCSKVTFANIIEVILKYIYFDIMYNSENNVCLE